MKQIPLYLGLAASLALGSAAFAQAPGGAAGNQKPMPQAEQKSAPPAAPAPSTAQPSPAPSTSGIAPSGRSGVTFNRDNSGARGSVTVNRRERGDSFRGGVTVGRNDRFDRGDRWRGDSWRYRHRIRPAFAFISGPRVYVRPGWCRGLHRGWHVAPGVGEHAGTHRGLFRC